MMEEGMQITLMTKTMRDFMGLNDVDDGTCLILMILSALKCRKIFIICTHCYLYTLMGLDDVDDGTHQSVTQDYSLVL